MLGGASNAVSDTGVLAKGEILVGDGTTDPTKLTVGADDTLLTADSAEASGVKWAAAAGGGGAWELITTATASNDASVEFTGLSSTYFLYNVVIDQLFPVESGVSALWLRTSTDNGASFDSGASDYEWRMFGTEGASDLDDNQINLTPPFNFTIENATGNGKGDWNIYLFNPSSSGRTAVVNQAYFIKDDGTSIRGGYADGYGARKESTGAVDAIQFLMSSDNISAGTFKLYGLKAS